MARENEVYESESERVGKMFGIIVRVFIIFGLVDMCTAFILIAIMSRRGSDPHDDRHREENEEQIEYLRKRRENEHNKT